MHDKRVSGPMTEIWSTTMATQEAKMVRINKTSKSLLFQNSKGSVTMLNQSAHRFHTRSPVRDYSVTAVSQSRSSRTKTILFWTPRIGRADWSLGYGKKPFRYCSYNNCQYTSDKGN